MIRQDVIFNQRAPLEQPNRTGPTETDIIGAQLARDAANAPHTSAMGEMLKALTEVSDKYFERERKARYSMQQQAEMQRMISEMYASQPAGQQTGLNHRGSVFSGYSVP